ncbi:phospholipase D [Clostridium acetobutylicum]|nr:phospholipase D [Clostridium acetobutylicum]
MKLGNFKYLLGIMLIVIICIIVFTRGDSDNKILVASKNIEYYFSQKDRNSDEELIEAIDSARERVDMAIYILQRQDIVNAVISAKKRGVVVRIITDRDEAATNYEGKELKSLKREKIPIKINTHSGMMHMKVTILDNSSVAAGSYNYTDPATEENDEVLVIVKNNIIAEKWENKFNNMWLDTGRFRNY